MILEREKVVVDPEVPAPRRFSASCRFLRRGFYVHESERIIPDDLLHECGHLL